jgi:uncharacterized protein
VIAPASAVYTGRLTHARRAPKRHVFSYRLNMLYLDLDEIDTLSAAWILRRGRFGLLSFCRADYLGPAHQPLKKTVLDLVETRLGMRPSGPVRLLTQVRWFGYVFNPVSFYYCFADDGHTLQAIVAEITNTPWQERHAYVLPAADQEVRAAFQKAFHVSPFFDMAQRYRWLLTTPGDRLAVTMVNEKDGREVFSASLSLEREPLTSTSLVRAVLRYPLMAWRVHLGIYMQAFALWRKRTPYFDHPARENATEAGRTIDALGKRPERQARG